MRLHIVTGGGGGQPTEGGWRVLGVMDGSNLSTFLSTPSNFSNWFRDHFVVKHGTRNGVEGNWIQANTTHYSYWGGAEVPKGEADLQAMANEVRMYEASVNLRFVAEKKPSEKEVKHPGIKTANDYYGYTTFLTGLALAIWGTCGRLYLERTEKNMMRTQNYTGRRH